MISILTSTFFSSERIEFVYFPTVLFWGLAYFIFNRFTYYNPTVINSFLKYFYKLCIMLIILVLISVFAGSFVSTKDFTANNLVYLPYFAFPWALSNSNSKLRLYIILLMSIVVYFTLKRTVFIGFILSVFAYYLIDRIVNQGGLNFKILFSMVSLTLLLYLSFTILDSKFGNVFTQRIEGISEDKGSGRFDIYDEVLFYQAKSSKAEWFLGHGHNSVVKVTKEKASAHNDWLEILYDYGLLAILLYVIINGYLIKYIFRLIRCRSKFAAPFAVSYIIFFISSISSNVIIYPAHFILITSFWGAVIGTTFQKPLNRKSDYCQIN